MELTTTKILDTKLKIDIKFEDKKHFFLKKKVKRKGKEEKEKRVNLHFIPHNKSFSVFKSSPFNKRDQTTINQKNCGGPL